MVPSPTTSVAARRPRDAARRGPVGAQRGRQHDAERRLQHHDGHERGDPREPQRAPDARDEQHRGPDAHRGGPRVGPQQGPHTERVRDDEHQAGPAQRDPGLRGHERRVGDDHRGEREEQPEHPEASRAAGGLRVGRGLGERDQPAGRHDDTGREHAGDGPPGPPLAPDRVPRAQHQLQARREPAPEEQADRRLPTTGGPARDERDREREHPHGHRDRDEPDDEQRAALERLDDHAQGREHRGAHQQRAGVGGAGRPPGGEQHDGGDQPGGRVGAHRRDRGVHDARRERAVQQRAAGAHHLQAHHGEQGDEPHPRGGPGVGRGPGGRARGLGGRHAREITPVVRRTAAAPRTGWRRWSRGCRPVP